MGGFAIPCQEVNWTSISNHEARTFCETCITNLKIRLNLISYLHPFYHRLQDHGPARKAERMKENGNNM